MNRAQDIISIRPQINFDTEAPSKEVEQFQNVTLRPVLKFQNTLTLKLLTTNTHFSKLIQAKPTGDQLKSLITQFLKTDKSFKTKLLGTIIGLFTGEEFDFYIQNKKEIDKRILSMQEERYISQLV